MIKYAFFFQRRNGEPSIIDTSVWRPNRDDTDTNSNSANDQSANDDQHSFPENPLNPFNTFNVSECEMQSDNSSTCWSEDDEHHYAETSELDELEQAGQAAARTIADELRRRQLSMSSDTGPPDRLVGASSATPTSGIMPLGPDSSTLGPNDEQYYDRVADDSGPVYMNGQAGTMTNNGVQTPGPRAPQPPPPPLPPRSSGKPPIYANSFACRKTETTTSASGSPVAPGSSSTRHLQPLLPPRPPNSPPSYANSVFDRKIETTTITSSASSSPIVPGSSHASRTTSSRVRLRSLPTPCDMSVTKSGCKWQGCQHLHVCVDWLSGWCSLVHRCRLPHSLSTAHNMTVLRAGGWREEQLEGVRRLLCFQACCERVKAAHLPPVCVNHARGLCQAQPCDALHMCPRFLALGVCDRKTCSLGHDLLGDENNRRVVVRSGNGDLTAKKLLKKITERIASGPHKH